MNLFPSTQPLSGYRLSLYHPPCPVWGTDMNDTFNQIMHLVQEMCEVTFLRNESQKTLATAQLCTINDISLVLLLNSTDFDILKCA